jgi:hypothetical protein
MTRTRSHRRPRAPRQARLAIGLLALALGLGTVPRYPAPARGADESRPPAAAAALPSPSLVDDDRHGPADAGLRPERDPAREVASRALEPALLEAPPSGSPPVPRPAAARARPGHRGPLVPTPSRHVLLCVWLT